MFQTTQPIDKYQTNRYNIYKINKLNTELFTYESNGLIL